VEDNADMRVYLGNSLDGYYNIIEARDGVQGIRKAIDTLPELIISDVMMPNMDGFEFCTKIKSDNQTSHIPLILLTARAAQKDKIEGLETGADDYITKPFDATELRVRVKNLVEQRRNLRRRFKLEIELKPDDIAMTSLDKKFITRALEIIEREMSNTEFDVSQFVREMGISRAHLYNKLQALTGQSAREFIRIIRLKRGAQLLRNHSGNITQIAYDVGFNSPAYFSVCFRKQFGRSPSQYAHFKDTNPS